MDNIIVMETTATNAHKAISLCGNEMIKLGFVANDFIDECIAREQEFPTGIIGNIPFAMPHVKSLNIKKDCLCFLRLIEPVEFRRMDDFEETISTQLIFNFAIKNPDGHIEFLQKFISLVQDGPFLEKCIQLPLSEVNKLLMSELNKNN